MLFAERFRWIRYHTLVDQRPAMISMDHTLSEDLEGKGYRFLGWVQLKAGAGMEPKPNLAQTRQLVMEMWPLLDSILADMPCRLAGLTVQESEIMFMFYSTERIRKFSVFRHFIKHWRAWHIQLGQVLDEDWETYHELLAPSREDRNHWRSFLYPV